ncbi:MAG: trypsin-like peptidase domain-containing protein [Bacteroidia bacterium]|nr:trypsin-like peptidase domain-containing protein [Bacteroidia bacterium]MBT8267631.1 trypsin-like peptidase domain-containing protein [Bacteroidia bacterium]NNF81167.1 PDZ domain-containing protein [Flavobacteriaceae bacterium]NNK71500.1 PDZ domain-containing protein [Flavobacteriaceae bacterium]NNL81019.1 PDZ domain-containing protein [Flavobacteriaceae bacterium]
MKKILTLILVSALGGAMTLGAYKVFYENENEVAEKPFELRQSPVINVSNPAMKSTLSIDFTYAAENTIDAVVHVKNTTISRGYTSLEDLIFGRSTPRAQIGTGSGVIISPDGYIITNNHVIEGAQSITITTNDNISLEADLIGTDPKTDIALLKVKYEGDLPFITFGDSDNSKIGEWVLAVGNPFNLNSTVTAGIISAKSRDLSGRNLQSFIQTDAAVNRGNSGGALVNVNGELIGINTAITSETGNYVGYSFAVPSNIARKVVQDIMEFGNVQNGILGITGQALNSEAARTYGIDETEGFLVSSVESESGAEKAGIRNGDIIKKLDNVEISKFSDMRGFLSAKRPDDVVKVTLLRNGNQKIVPVTLIRNLTVIVPQIGTLKKANAKELKTFGAKNGVKLSLLTSIDYYKKYWNKMGINEGVIVTAINGVDIYSIDDVERIMAERVAEDPITIDLINKEGKLERYSFGR